MTNQASIDGREALLTSQGHRMNWGLTDLHGSWQRGGHIQSHLTHSALTLDPLQSCPTVNSHLQGSIALDHRLGPLAGVPRAVEGSHRKVEVGRRLVGADLTGARPLTNDDVGDLY